MTDRELDRLETLTRLDRTIGAREVYCLQILAARAVQLIRELTEDE